MGLTLRATTCLGENTDTILGDVVGALRDRGVSIEFDESEAPADREAGFRSGVYDLAWACGLLTIDALGEGLDMEIVARPVFAGEVEAVYRSVVVVRSDADVSRVSDTFGGHLAVNEYGSWSGYRGFARWLTEQGFSVDDYATHVVTGAHRDSVRAVAEGVADVAAVDHTVWEHLVGTDPVATGVRVLARTGEWPAPPFSASPGVAAELRRALPDVHVPGLHRIEPTDATPYAIMR